MMIVYHIHALLESHELVKKQPMYLEENRVNDDCISYTCTLGKS